MTDLSYSVDNGIGTILLNRPDRKNAFTLALLDEWLQEGWLHWEA